MLVVDVEGSHVTFAFDPEDLGRNGRFRGLRVGNLRRRSGGGLTLPLLLGGLGNL